MKTINKNTRAGQRLIDSYNCSKIASIYECYCNPSTAKTRAEYLCREQMRRENGNGYKVISFNTFSFSVAWRVPQGLRIETSCNSYLVTE